MTYEARHRELRENAPFEAEHVFSLRTGPLVDDLVAAVREEHRHHAQPDGSAQWIQRGVKLGEATRAALVALDAEAARG